MDEFRFHGQGVEFHDQPPSASARVPSSPFFEGRFGRMFRNVPVFGRSDAFLQQLAAQMLDEGEIGPDKENDRIPAGYTYLGQFVDHDLTFDPTSSLQRTNDPLRLVNFRSPRFDLDCLYGSGPDDDPFLYDRTSRGGTKLLVGKVPGSNEDDLPRNSQGRALIGDPRNDENTFVSQLHLAFIKLHNKVVDEVATTGLAGSGLFKEAQRIARWHYQWVVIHDYLPKVIGEELFKRIAGAGPGEQLEPKLRLYRARVNAYMPVEFSAAAFRFGHTQVRGRYRINQLVPEFPTFDRNATPDSRSDFRGFRPLPSGWTLSWPFFFSLDDAGPQLSRRIDTKLAQPLFELPGESGEMQSLALRNLRRGAALELPSGERVAEHIGVKPLTDADLGFDEPGPAPLWFYVLREADKHGGKHLGEVGGTIVAETFLGLLKNDPLSYFRVQPDWRPTLGPEPGNFGIADLLRFAVPEQTQRR